MYMHFPSCFDHSDNERNLLELHSSDMCPQITWRLSLLHRLGDHSVKTACTEMDKTANPCSWLLTKAVVTETEIDLDVFMSLAVKNCNTKVASDECQCLETILEDYHDTHTLLFIMLSIMRAPN